MSAIGIDLGTTNSCVAVVENMQVGVLANDMGHRVTPSCVAFTENGRLIGDAAKLQMKDNSENTIFGIKRLIGRKFTDEAVQNDKTNWPFEVVNDNGRPKIRTKAEKRAFQPEEISGMILAKMKEIAEDRTGRPISNAVVTVPAYFNDAQRDATLSAAKVANLRVMRILNEPTAAAIAYGAQENFRSERTVLVYDLGGGTFDITLLTIKGSDFKVIATGGDTHLGGDDFDQVLAKYLAKEFERIHGINVINDTRAMAILNEESEKKKIYLSASKTQKIAIGALSHGKTLKMEITRATFENLNSEYFMNSFRIVDQVLIDGNVNRSQIDDVLLVGGSTRIPFIRAKLMEMFGANKIRKSINPDEAVAYGAAVYAAYLSGSSVPNIGDVRLQEVTPLSLGINTKGGLTSVIIKRNTRIPTMRQNPYETTENNQTVVRIDVYEGERARVQDNHLLATFNLGGIPPMPAGKAKIMVKFAINDNGVLDVSAYETVTGNTNFISIETDRNRLTDREIEEMRQIAKKYRMSDAKVREKVAARNNLEKSICDVKRRTLSWAIKRKCEEIEKWTKNNQNARKEDFVQKQREFEAFVSTH